MRFIFEETARRMVSMHNDDQHHLQAIIDALRAYDGQLAVRITALEEAMTEPAAMTDDDKLRDALGAMAEQYQRDEDRRTAAFQAQLARYAAELAAAVLMVEKLGAAYAEALVRMGGMVSATPTRSLPALTLVPEA